MRNLNGSKALGFGQDLDNHLEKFLHKSELPNIRRLNGSFGLDVGLI